MTTILFLHAHPDDECILTGATMAKAHAAGCRVVVAYATRGDAGETSADLGGQTLGERREDEARAACAELGVDRVVFLNFDDSGMAGTETTKNPAAFCNVAMDEVLARLSIALVNETVTAVVGYDRNGTYGHPDHIRIHKAAFAAAPALRAHWVLEATYNRDFLATLGNGGDDDGGYDEMQRNFEGFASGEDELTHLVQGLEWFAKKGKAIRHHASQVPDDWNESEPDMQGFADRFGVEWFIATPIVADADFAPLSSVFDEKNTWTGERLVL